MRELMEFTTSFKKPTKWNWNKRAVIQDLHIKERQRSAYTSSWRNGRTFYQNECTVEEYTDALGRRYSTKLLFKALLSEKQRRSLVGDQHEWITVCYYLYTQPWTGEYINSRTICSYQNISSLGRFCNVKGSKHPDFPRQQRHYRTQHPLDTGFNWKGVGISMENPILFPCGILMFHLSKSIFLYPKVVVNPILTYCR